jgi:hypothetical protein
MKKALSYLGCISEIVVSLATFFALLSSFAYLLIGMVDQNIYQARDWHHLLIYSAMVLFFGVFILCALSFMRGTSRLGKLLASESTKTKLQLRGVILLIALVAMSVSIWFFGIKK